MEAYLGFHYFSLVRDATISGFHQVCLLLLCLLDVTDALRSRTLANAKLIDILESQLAIL